MAGNSFGTLFRLTSFGESHGAAIGGVIDGCPPGITIDSAFIRSEMRRRRPSQSKIVTQRKEEDEVEFLSGIFEGKSTGAPIGFLVRNADARSKDYDALKIFIAPLMLILHTMQNMVFVIIVAEEGLLPVKLSLE